MNRLLTKLALLSVMAMMLTGHLATAAQSPTEDANDPRMRSELAATVLTADDLPVGYAFLGESFLSADAIAGNGGADTATLTDAGFIAAYVSVYENGDSGSRIRSYVSAWNDEDAARAGFDLVEDESSSEAMTDDSIEIGEEPREISKGTYNDADGNTVGVVDVAFRSGDRLIGVAVETNDGSEADDELVQNLASRLYDRAQSVQNGDSLANIDLQLPGRMISLATEGTEIQTGFLGPTEVESIYAVQGSVLSSVSASWVQTVAIGENVDGPLVSIGVSTFDTPEDAVTSVEQSSDIFAPLTDQQAVEHAPLVGTDTVRAYRYSSSSDETNALDSYRIIYASGTDLVVIDIQGAPSGEVAADTANTLAAAQLACESGDACTTPELPSEIIGP